MADRTAETDDLFERAAIAANAVEAACEAWRIGRGRPVLQDSQYVTRNFIDELNDLAQRLNGDARAIIATLEGGGVTPWRSSNTESLSDYFEANGYLAADTPCSNRDLGVRVISAVADRLNAGRIDRPAIDRIIGALLARRVSGNGEPTDTTLID